MKIIQLERDAATGFVNVVHWVISDVDADGNTGSVYGSIGLEGELVTPFEQLTEDQVIGWVEAALGAETLAAHAANVAAQIAEAKAPKVATGMPW